MDATTFPSTPAPEAAFALLTTQAERDCFLDATYPDHWTAEDEAADEHRARMQLKAYDYPSDEVAFGVESGS